MREGYESIMVIWCALSLKWRSQMYLLVICGKAHSTSQMPTTLPTRKDSMPTPCAVKFGTLDDLSTLRANDSVEDPTDAQVVLWTCPN